VMTSTPCDSVRTPTSSSSTTTFNLETAAD
jgi:hypothetical protein